MFDDFVAWVQAVLGDSYQYSAGMWVDHPGLAGEFVCAVLQEAGRAPDVDVRRPRYRVILLGPRNGREHNGQIISDAGRLVQACIDGALVPCGAAIVRATTEPSGPGYTTENRAFAQVNFEVLF